MIYKTGKIGVNEGAALIVMLLLPNMYLSEPSLSIGFVGSSAWLLKIISGCVATGALLTILYCYQQHAARFHGGECIDFYQFTRELIGRQKARLLFFFWAVLFEIQTILLLREFSDHVLITTLPTSRLPVIVLLLAGCMGIILLRGLEVILRTAYVLFLLSALGVVVVVVLLTGFFEFDQLFPWQGYGLLSLAKYSFSDLGTWLLCFAILLLAPNLQTFSTVRRSILYGFGYTILLKTMLVAAAILVFGTIVAPERSMLFYEMVQAINLSQYLQRVDAAFIMIWLPGGLMSALLMQFFALTLFCKVFDLRDFKVLIPMAVALSAVFSLLPSSVVAVIELNRFLVYVVFSAFMAVNFTIFIVGHFVKSRRDASCAGNTK